MAPFKIVTGEGDGRSLICVSYWSRPSWYKAAAMLPIILVSNGVEDLTPYRRPIEFARRNTIHRPWLTKRPNGPEDRFGSRGANAQKLVGRWVRDRRP